jgi:transcriptional regulator with XRE-family HTH domain
MPRDHRKDFGTFIAIHREEQKLTGTKVGAAAGVTQAVYSNWETCKSVPETADQVRAVAQTLSISESRLVAIWKKTVRATKKKGKAIVTRAYQTTSGRGGSTTDPY